jgi:hypothetical protein
MDGLSYFQSWDWKIAVRKLPARHNTRKIDLLAKAVTSHALCEISSDAMSMLTSLAREHPDDVMRVVGESALSPEGAMFFLIDEFEGLFEAISLDAIQRWVKQSGPRAAKVIAPYLLGPAPKQDDPRHIPALTEWLLSEYEDDDQVFEEFRSGRYSRKIYIGSRSGCFEGTEDLLKPYLDHPLRRVREWAQYEIDYLRGLQS